MHVIRCISTGPCNLHLLWCSQAKGGHTMDQDDLGACSTEKLKRLDVNEHSCNSATKEIHTIYCIPLTVCFFIFWWLCLKFSVYCLIIGTRVFLHVQKYIINQ